MKANNSVKVVNQKHERINQAGQVLSVKAGKVKVKMDIDGVEVVFSKNDLVVLGA